MKARDDAPHHRAPTSAEERDRMIVALRRKGWTLRNIAARLGMSKSGVADPLARIPTGRPARDPRAM